MPWLNGVALLGSKLHLFVFHWHVRVSNQLGHITYGGDRTDATGFIVKCTGHHTTAVSETFKST